MTPSTAAEPLTAAVETPGQQRRCEPRSDRRERLPSIRCRGDDTATWSEGELDALRGEFGDTYAGRTCLVTGADGFMGSHLTEALVASRRRT